MSKKTKAIAQYIVLGLVIGSILFIGDMLYAKTFWTVILGLLAGLTVVVTGIALYAYAEFTTENQSRWTAVDTFTMFCGLGIGLLVLGILWLIYQWLH